MTYSKINVLMIPGKNSVNEPSGISRVIENYLKYAGDFGIDFTDNESKADLVVSHAGVTGSECDVSILHGIYFTGDYRAPSFEYIVNQRIVDSLRSSKAVTVPSTWVSEIIQRDMHINPFVVPHGIDYKDWEHNYEHGSYVLYNKNRDSVDVCDSSQLDQLARMAPEVNFISTFSKDNLLNVETVGVRTPIEMKHLVQKASAYLSVTKETFGIGVLEALASGVPVLGWRIGGNIDTVQHGVTGYLAEPGNYDDLLTGLFYIIKYRKVLSENAKIASMSWSWSDSVSKLRDVFDYALHKKNSQVSVSVIVPTYNYASKISGCIESINNQTVYVDEIIIVDDGSKDNTEEVVTNLSKDIKQIKYIKKENGGVATARNVGGKASSSKYLCFIDPDDRIEPNYIETCVNALARDNTLYIAYTGLRWVKPDGTTGISEWPGQYNFDEQLKGHNQVPTCCVMKREVFDRTGGYRQRYAPDGAGSEDADLWTRAGALGMKARKVSDDGLFIYSLGTGNVSGNTKYKEVNWLEWNGYINTGLHPFASLATPRNVKSHNVYQYDQPTVSVIIPVGPGHEDKIYEAIDSVEGQTYKKWELILVDDTGGNIKDIINSYPYIKYLETNKPKSGPGVARNLGANNARGSFLLFLDADDWFTPDAIETFLSQWSLSKSIIYSDYYGISTISDKDYLVKLGNRLVDYNEKNKRAVVIHKSDDYNCLRAQSQPADPLYHWCVVSCLIPTAWHKEIGGFDEKMESWEDVDYHWRMARAGYCYTRIDKPLFYYRYDTGKRRNLADPSSNLDVAKKLISYMDKKYEGIKNMACKTCGGSGNVVVNTPTRAVVGASSSGVNDSDYIMCIYNHPNKGEHSVIGPSTGINYGYRSGGDKFLVHVNDTNLMPMLFIADTGASNVSGFDAPKEEIVVPPEPKKLSVPEIKKFDINLIPGVTPAIAKKLSDAGISTKEEFKKITEDFLLGIDGISKTRASAIMSIVEKMNEL